MKTFFETRPLSVVATFSWCGLSALTGVFGLIQFSRMMAVAKQYAAYEDLPLVNSSSIHSLTFAFALAAAVVPLLTMAALYRDSTLGLRVLKFGTLALAVASLAAGVFPTRYFVEAGLISWLAYEVNGFNIIKWFESRLVPIEVKESSGGDFPKVQT